MMNNYTTKSESYDHTLHALPTEALNYLPGIFFSELKPNYLLIYQEQAEVLAFPEEKM